MLRKFIASLIFFLIIIGVYFVFADKTGYYYNRVFSADKIKRTDIDKGRNVIYVVGFMNSFITNFTVTCVTVHRD